jgi:hypothetical protein
MPSESLLQKKIQGYKLPPGFLHGIDPILSAKVATLSKKERVVHLSMDEV